MIGGCVECANGYTGCFRRGGLDDHCPLTITRSERFLMPCTAYAVIFATTARIFGKPPCCGRVENSLPV